MASNTTLFRIKFINQNQIYEIYAKCLINSEIYGFITISELVFDWSKSVVIDPTEEKLKQEFNDVNCLHIPINHIIRIEEVKNKKTCKITPLKTEPKTTHISQSPSYPK